MPPANRPTPKNRIHLPPTLSAYRPASGATNIEITDIGAVVRPACSADRPSTVCRKIVSGRNSPNMPKLIAVTTPFMMEKLRLRKIENGTSGSPSRSMYCR
jgi:hypothetical protein